MMRRRVGMSSALAVIALTAQAQGAGPEMLDRSLQGNHNGGVLRFGSAVPSQTMHI